MAKSKDAVARRYDEIRARVAKGEKIADAIAMELADSKIAPSTLRAAYLSLAHQKGHTKSRPPQPALDIEDFKTRFDAAVAEREARERSGFSVLVEQIGDHLRAVASKHPPGWVRATIASCGVAVSVDEFKAWLEQVGLAASRQRRTPGARGAPRGGAVPRDGGQNGPDPGSRRDAGVPAADATASDRAPDAPAKPPRPTVLGKQKR